MERRMSQVRHEYVQYDLTFIGWNSEATTCGHVITADELKEVVSLM